MSSAEIRFDEGHMWVRVDGGTAVMGLSDYAQDQLGEIIFVELPEEGTVIIRGDACGTVESVKSVEDLIAPASGEVSRINEDVLDAPEAINQDPYGDGWLLEAHLEDPAEAETLMTAHEYEKFLDTLEGDADEDVYEEEEEEEQ
jgi:glycine cleavage system H protein